MIYSSRCLVWNCFEASLAVTANTIGRGSWRTYEVPYMGKAEGLMTAYYPPSVGCTGPRWGVYAGLCITGLVLFIVDWLDSIFTWLYVNPMWYYSW